MFSKAHLHMKSLLTIISKMYNVMLLEEVKDGSKRYDFYFPTFTPIVIEVNGDNHNLDKVDGFFFKSTETLIKYKRNDEERRVYDKLGKIKLITFTDKEFPSLDELLEILEVNNAISLLERGNNERNIHYKFNRRNQEESQRRKERNREFRKKLKERNINSNRPK